MLNVMKSTVVAAGLFAGSAQALVIDFTDLDVWSIPSHTSSKTVSYGDLDVTLTAKKDWYNSSLNNTPYDGKTPCEDFGGAGLECESDGIGIGRYDDEVGKREWLVVEFSEAIELSSLTFLDLFAYSGSDPKPEGAEVYSLNSSGDYEIGRWLGTANNDQTGFFTAQTNNGDVTDSGIFDDITKLYFTVGHDWCNWYSDYSLAAIDIVRDVPEPATWALFGAGLCSLIITRRHLKKAQ